MAGKDPYSENQDDDALVKSIGSASSSKRSAVEPNPFKDEIRGIVNGLNAPKAPSSEPNPFKDEIRGILDQINGVKPPGAPGFLADDPNDSDYATTGKFLATGALKGLSHFPGVVGDVRDLGDYVWDWTQSKVGGRPLDVVRTENAKRREAAEKALYGEGWTRYLSPRNLPSGADISNAIGKHTGLYEPTSTPGKIAMAGVEGLFSPPVGALGAGARAADVALNVAKTAPYSAVAGATTGALAENGVENPFLLMGAGALSAAGAQKGVQAAGRATRPWRQEGRLDLAGETLRGQTEDPDAVIRNLEAATERVPGSRPLTGPESGDVRMQQFEREMRTQDPEYQRAAVAWKNEGDDARLRAFEGLEPNGSPEMVHRVITDSFDSLRRAHDDTVAIMQERAQGANDALGPDRTLSGIGDQARSVMQRRYTAARRLTSRLYNAIEDANPTISVGSLRNGMAEAYGRLTPEERMGLTPQEMRIVSMVGSYEPAMPFQRLRGLEGQLNEALAQTRGESPGAYRRLSMLRSALERSYADAAAETVATQSRAVQAGTMRQEDTLAAIIEKLRAEADAFLERSGAGYRIDVGADGSARRGTVPPGNGGEVPPAGGTGNAAGDPQVPGGEALRPEVLADLRRARASRRDTGTRFERDPVSSILAVEPRTGQFVMAPERVPAQVFRGDREGGGQAAQRFLEAAGPRGAPILLDAAIERMRSKALTDGLVDPAKLERFVRDHREALSRIPGALERFRTAADATEAMEAAATARRVAIEAAQADSAGQILGLSASDTPGIGRVVGRAISGDDGVSEARRLVGMMGGDPDALAGLRAGLLDWLKRSARSDGKGGQEGLKPQSFKEQVGRNRAAISEILTPAQMGVLDSLADDISMVQRWTEANKLPGTPQSAADLVAAMRRRAQERPPMTDGEALAQGMTFGSLVGLGAIAQTGAVAVATNRMQRAISMLRSHGISAVDDLVRQAMLDPRFAAELMKRTPRSSPTFGQSFQRALSRIGVYSSMYDEEQ